MSVLYIAPTRMGSGDGSSWENAGSLKDLGSFVAKAGAGGEVLLRADQGSYKIGPIDPTIIASGGTEGAPVTIRGVDGAGDPMKAVIVGARAPNWVDGAADGGQEVFQLRTGANHLVFESLQFNNIGNGAFRIGGAISDLTVQDISADNVQRFLLNDSLSSSAPAPVDGLIVSNVDVHGFSKGVIELRDSSSNILIQDVFGDSEAQDGDKFAMGVHLLGSVHDVVLRRTSMLNSHDSTGNYWNGDGYATERGVHDVRFEDTYAGGSTDGGYDIKSSDTILLRAVAEGNKRNFRLWADSITVEDSVSLNPHIFGGSGTQAHFWIAKGATPTVIDTQLIDNSDQTVAFDADEGGGALLTLDNVSYSLSGGAFLTWLARGSSIILNGVQYGTMADGSVVGTEKNDVVEGFSGSDVLHGQGGNDLLLGAAGADVLDGGTGNDTVSYFSSLGTVSVDLTTGLGTGNDAEGDVLISIENLRGTIRGDRFFGNDEANVLRAEAGNDVLEGGGGADILDGGVGTDTASYSRSLSGVTVDLTLGTGLGGDAQGDVLIGTENLQGSELGDSLTGDSGNNLLSGKGGDDTLVGLDGNDTLEGGTGTDTMIGGTGDDTYIVESATDTVIELPGGGNDTVRTNLATYALSAEVEGLVYSGSSSFHGIGNELANSLTGGSGNDVLEGGGGPDLLNGSFGSDTASYASSSSGVVADLMAGGVSGDATGDVYVKIENLAGSELGDTLSGNDARNTLSGNGGNDTLDGRGGDDVLDGGLGDDTLLGGGGNDVFVVDSVGDAVVEASEDGADTVRTTLQSYSLGPNVENLVSIGSLPFTGTGNDLDNAITGGDGADALHGAGGQDSLSGGLGADALDGGAGLDTAVYTGSLAAVAIDLAAGTASGGDADGDVLTDIENVTGSIFGDTLVGNAGPNVLDGGLGADRMTGGAGDDTYGVDDIGDVVKELVGGGTDTVRTSLAAYALAGTLENLEFVGTGDFAGTGNDAANLIRGGDGNDALVGGEGADRLYGGLGNDALNGGKNEDQLYGGDGADTLTGGWNSDQLFGEAGTDTLIGDNPVIGQGSLGAKDIVDGGDGDDVIYGDGIFLTGNGAGGGDTLRGSAGNDVIYGDALGMSGTSRGGDDTLSGGDGDDTLYGDALTADVTTTGGDDKLIGGAGADRLFGGGGHDALDGGDGDDLLVGGASSDNLVGGAGIDTADYSASAAAVSINLTTGKGIGGDAQGDTLGGVENLIGSIFDDVLTGNAAANRLDGGTGADTMAGLQGDDVYIVDSPLDTVTELAQQGTDTVVTSTATYVLGPNVENLIYTGASDFQGTGNELDNVMTGGIGADTLSGGGGNDTLDGKAGIDHLEGGTGDDIYRVDDTLDVVIEGAGGGTDTVVSTAAAFALGAQIENLTFEGVGPFVGTGNELANVITGGDGTDTLDGRGGLDTLVGGAGNDTYIVDRSDDVVVEQLGGGVDLVISHANAFTLAHDVDNLVFDGVGSFSGIGNGLANSLTGGTGDDFLDGRAGADLMTGGAGNDTYVVDHVGDVVVEATGGGTDTIQTTLSSYSLGATLENLVYTGMDPIAFTGNGNASANTITGGLGNDTLNGNDGSDKIFGGFGNDTISGGKNEDQLHGGDGSDNINGGLNNDELYGDAGNDFLSGDSSLGQDARGSNDRLEGGADNDTLLGDGQSMTGNAIGGKDTLIGGTGNDTLYGDAVTMSGTSAGGDDKLAGGDGNDIIYGDAATMAATTKGGADSLSGDAGDDQLFGGLGNDTLNGGADNDTLDGGKGNDSLIGGAGSDLFLFAAGGGHDIVQDFVRGGVDHLQISGYSGYQELRQVGADTLVVFSATDDVLLKNVTALSLTSADLFFI